MTYKYTLEPYSGPGSRYTCPGCKKPKQFTRYIDAVTGKYISPYVGRCNRENSCGYHCPPRNNSKISSSRRNVFSKKKSASKSNKMYIDKDLWKATLSDYENNYFFQGLRILFDPEIAEELLKHFSIGTYNSSTIFWQTYNGYVRAGKIMKYDPNTLNRKGNVYWYHYLLNDPDFVLNQCLFGLNQVVQETKEVRIVESEKTAIIMKGIFPNEIWLATGGINNLNSKMLDPVKDKNILLFPDIGAETKWAKFCINKENCTVVNWPNMIGINRSGNNGKDLADFSSLLFQNRLNNNNSE